MRSVLIALTVFLISACASVKEKSAQQPVQTLVAENTANTFEMQMKGINFNATGEDSQWVLEIDFDRIVKFSSSEIDKDFEVHIQTLGEGLKGPDARYQVANSEVELIIDIMSKEKPFVDNVTHPFEVSINYTDLKSNQEKNFRGDGVFYGAIRLHDIWVLEQINGEKIELAPDMQRPFMEIHLDKRRGMGNLGCNTFSTDLYFGREQINFSYIMSTKMACPNLKVEQRFAKAMGNKTYDYRFDELQLILENETDTLTFKRTD